MLVGQEGHMSRPSNHSIQIYLVYVEVNFEPMDAPELAILLPDAQQVV